MRRLFTTALTAALVAVLLATTTAVGDTTAKIWRLYGDRFQLGYVVGYLEAIRLSQRRDQRTLIPAGGKKFDRWIRDINAYLDDPNNADRTVPDAIGFVGARIRQETLDAWTNRNSRARPSPSPSPGA